MGSAKQNYGLDNSQPSATLDTNRPIDALACFLGENLHCGRDRTSSSLAKRCQKLQTRMHKVRFMARNLPVQP